LIGTINKQKNDLKNANKEIHDIALFPMQNPDPLLRINFQGDLLKNNPAASSLDFFEFENKTLRNDEFFRIIAERVDKDNPRWAIEASSGNKVYSFLCASLKEDGYINIYGRDITDIKKTENELTRLSLVASTNENGVMFTDHAGRITWVNDGFCRLSGYNREEIIGKVPIELFMGPLTDKDTVNKILEAFYRGDSFKEEVIFYRKDRSYFWGFAQSQVVKDGEGEKSEFFGIIQDVTAKRETQEKLKVLSQIAEDNINAVIIADREGKISWVNKSFYNMTGYTAEEAIGKKPGQLLQGPETDRDTIKYLAGQIASGKPFSTEILNYRKNGQKYWLRIQGQPIENEKGETTGFFALEEDITKEKESEQRFQLVVDNIGDNFWEHDFRTGVTHFSKSVHTFLGVQTNEAINPQQLWWQSIHPEDLYIVQESDRKYKAGLSEGHNLEYRVADRAGSLKWVLDRGVVVDKDREGRPLRIIGTHIDISRQKSLESELKKAKEDAEASTKAKESFLANMSHEIRTPMNAIMGMSNQLAKTMLSQEQTFFLDIIRSSTDNLLVIINDILDLSKIEAGKLSLESIGFELPKVVDHAMQVLMHKAEEKGLLLTNPVSDSRISPVLLGDPYRLNQVLLNLIGNAIKFTEKGKVEVSISLLTDAEDHQLVKVSIADTGIGMEQKFVDDLFDKFSQEYGSTTRRYGGTGLGMSICKELVELMGGRIDVKSTKGLGTTISFEVQFSKGKLEDIPEINSESYERDFLKGRKVLVVDDNEMNRLVASVILNSYGAIITEAVNGNEAIEVLNRQPVDMVLMDIQMPVKNGYEATREIRASGINTPIIALTANAIKGESEKCLAAGMNDYLNKPFEERDLIEVISKWLGSKLPEIVEKPAEQAGSALFDLSKLRGIANGNVAFVKKMIQLFMDQTPPSVAAMEAAYQANDFESVSKIAHRIKPSIDNMGIVSLKNDIREIELQAVEYQQSERLFKLIDHVKKVIEMVVDNLKDEDNA
jgi:PAS domain S-box-containing protein